MSTSPAGSPAGAAAVRAVGLSRSFRTGGGTVNACTDISLDARAGELVVVTGKSGAGKTTLLNMLSTLDRPDSGQLFFAGRDVADLTGPEVSALRREQLGIVFQSFGLLPILSAAENVEVPLRLLAQDAATRRDRVAEVLGLVGLDDHADQRPDELSGGQQQRVAIARALAADPGVIIADEPTGQLDDENAAAIIRLLHLLTRERGSTVVVATHDPRFVEVADRHLNLVDGRGVVT